MKSFIFALLGAMIATGCTPKETTIWESEVVKVSSDGIIYLSNGSHVQLLADTDYVVFYDQQHVREGGTTKGEYVYQWKHAVPGMVAQKVLSGRHVYYEILPAPNYVKNHIVKEVSRYGGDMRIISSSAQGKRSWITGKSSQKGYTEDKDMSYDNTFINIIFEDGDAITVDVKNNYLWLEVEPGNKVQETRINNVVSYSPVF